jgi:hypothetical protein
MFIGFLLFHLNKLLVVNSIYMYFLLYIYIYTIEYILLLISLYVIIIYV